jgi:FAD/FMN-containing dehydrogenase
MDGASQHVRMQGSLTRRNNVAHEALVKDLEEIVGPENVTDKEFELAAYARDWSYEGPLRPDIIVVPGSTEEVSGIMKLANRTKTPVCIRGGGTTTTGMSLPREGGIVIDLNRMDRIGEIDEDAMVITMQAGATVFKLIKIIEQKGWKIPLKPKFGSGVSVAGWASFNGVGAGGAIYGRVTDILVGLEVVLPTGEIVKTGSLSFKGAKQFCRYQGTGPDLTGLFLNTFGTMGVMTEITFRVYRKPETEGFIGYGFDTAEDAQEGIRLLTEANISYGINLYDDEMCKIAGLPVPAPWMVHLFAEGWKEEVDFRLRKGREIMEKAGIGKEMPDAIPFWYGVEGMSSRMKPPMRTACVGGFHPLGITAEVFHAYNRVGEKFDLPRGMVWWVINNYANIFPIYIYYEETELDKMIQAAHDLRVQWSDLGCTPDYPGPNPDITDRITPEYLAFYKRIKKELDPNHIMHRGMSPRVNY